MTETSTNEQDTVTIPMPSERDPLYTLQEPPPAYHTHSCQSTMAQTESDALPPCYHSGLWRGEQTLGKGPSSQPSCNVLNTHTDGSQESNRMGISARKILYYLIPVLAILATIIIGIFYAPFNEGSWNSHINATIPYIH